ncbi:MAG: hypothetical protein N2C12_04470, partial [Planctomycetales bacterium]
ISSDLLARVLHHLLAAVAIVSVVIAVRTSSSGDNIQGTNGSTSQRLTRRAAWWALAASVLQIPVGVWLMLEISGYHRDLIMGANWVASGLFLSSLVAALILMYQLAAVALGETDRRSVWRAAALLMLVVLLMSGVLELISDV